MTGKYLKSENVAVVTGAASGIGRAACQRLAALGMNVVMADIDADRLAAAARTVAETAPRSDAAVRWKQTDVGDAGEIAALADFAFDQFGRTDFLMNNAAIRVAGGDTEDIANWRRTMDVNFWAAVYAERAFLPRMLKQGEPAAIVNTGSKQGITNPPGNLIYNVTKSAIKTYTEGLQHQLRNTRGCQVNAHLLVPGWTTTGDREHKPGAWLPEQVVDRLVVALENGDFYIICPDDEVTPEMDHRRMLWGVGDIIENRPPLSRWHPDWKDKFR